MPLHIKLPLCHNKKIVIEPLSVNKLASRLYVMLCSHCRFSPIDSESHRQNEECQQVQTNTPCSKKVDNSLVDEVEHVLRLVDFCRQIDRNSFSLACFLIFQYLCSDKCFKHLFFHD